MDLGALYRDVVETSPDGIGVFDLDGRFVYANPALRRLFGAGEDEMLGLTVLDTLDEVGQEQFRAHLQDLRAGRINEHPVEVMFVRRDGTSLWTTVSEAALRGPDGELVGVVHRLTDDSERHRTVDGLSAEGRRLAEAQRIARIGSWEWDVDADQIWGSEELMSLYGLDRDSFPASYSSFLGIVHEDDRASVDQAVQQAVREGGEFVFVARVRGPEDSWVWTRGRGVAQRDRTGRVVAMYGTHQDVTETKLAEIALEDQVRQNTLLQMVASTANEATALVDVLRQARHLVLLHDDWERGRAFVPTEDRSAVVPLHVSEQDRLDDLATPVASAIELDVANRAYREKRSVWDDAMLTIAFTVSYADEVVGVLTITSAPPLYRHDMIQSMVEQVAVQLGRVAERERAQRELADARDQAMEASRQKSEFLATMSHEIRTPLNGVIGLNELLLRTSLDPDQLRLASGVQMASRSLLALINDVLDFSKIEAGMLELERVDFEVRPLLDQVAALLAESVRSKGLELVVSCDPDVPEVLAGDPTRLSQVLTNLGSNAVKFTESGEVVIRLTAEPGSSGRTALRVTVTDTGVGVPEVDVHTLFEAFTQADASTTRRFGGTGLGLAISREIVEALGGEIGLEPNPGGGSVFWFTAELDPPAGSGADPDEEHARRWLSGRRVLVVDDNEHRRRALADQLATWDVRCTAVADVGAAERELATDGRAGAAYDAVLVDLDLPEQEAAGLVRALGAAPAWSGLPVVGISTSTAPPGLGAVTDCVGAPVLATDLRATLLRHLAGVEPRPEGEQPAEATERGRTRLLVVEDNAVNQMVAVGLLEALGYSARTADDGVAALEALQEETFDAVLMDVQMPRMDGYATTRAIRAAESAEPGRSARRLPVIAMTAAAIEGERERCLAAGMDDFLTKPVDPAALAAVLEAWVPGTRPGPESGPEPGARRTVTAVGTSDDQQPARASAQADLALLEELVLERLDELRDIDPDTTAYLDRAIANFVANTPGTLETIRTAAAAGDAATLKQVSHKLAGGALNLGVEEAGRTAQQVELLADTGSTEGADVLVERLAAALERGRAALLAYQATYSRN